MTLADIFSNNIVKYVFISVAVITLIGLLVDAALFLKEKCSKNEASKETAVETPLDMIVKPSGSGSKPSPSGKLDREITKLKEDVGVIKETLQHINLSMKYKQTCTVCAWNR